MTNDDPFIDTGIGKIRASEARGYFRGELERTTTPNEPRDVDVLLGMLRTFPKMLQRHSAREVINDFTANPNHFVSGPDLVLLREARMIAYAPYGEGAGEYICFGDLSRNEMGKQCQYGSFYVHGKIEGYPNLGDGLRLKGDPLDYHSLRMHVDDVPTFMQRYCEYREARKRV